MSLRKEVYQNNYSGQSRIPKASVFYSSVVHDYSIRCQKDGRVY